jgi:ubiquinone/menaquinone biosynthesis C-methylase UbiE
LDVATGNGQVAAALSGKFEKVYATDISEKQLAQAIQKENITYKKEAAEKFSFADESFDLITVAQAIHWFDFEHFFKEVQRTLKPGGLICIIGYGLLRADDATNEIIDHFYKTVIGPYWDKERKHIDEAYRNIPFPFQSIESPELFMEFEWPLDHFVKYLETWSAVQHYIKINGTNPIGCDMTQLLQENWPVSESRKIRFPLFIKTGRKK